MHPTSYYYSKKRVKQLNNYVDSLGVKHALQQPDWNTLIEQLVKLYSTVIKQHFAKHNHNYRKHNIEAWLLGIA